MTVKQALKDLGIKQEDVAKKLGISKAAVSAWNRNGVPPKHCPEVEAMTGGKLTRKQLRPDDWQKFWPEQVG